MSATQSHLPPTASAPPPTELPAQPAGSRYRPLRLHARGGLGEVYLAEDAECGREVALKTIERLPCDPQQEAHQQQRHRAGDG